MSTVTHLTYQGSVLRRRLGVPHEHIEPLAAVTDGTVIILLCIHSSLIYSCVQYGSWGEIQVPLGIGVADGTLFVLFARVLGFGRFPALFTPQRALARLSASWAFV